MKIFHQRISLIAFKKKKKESLSIKSRRIKKRKIRGIMGAHITETKRKGSKRKKKEKIPLPIWNNIDNVTILHPVSSRFSSVFNDHGSKRWSRFEKNITILFRSPGFPFVRPRGEINRSLMRRRFSPTCNPHFVQPNFSYFLFFPSFLFSLFSFSFFFFLSSRRTRSPDPQPQPIASTTRNERADHA